MMEKTKLQPTLNLGMCKSCQSNMDDDFEVTMKIVPRMKETPKVTTLFNGGKKKKDSKVNSLF